MGSGEFNHVNLHYQLFALSEQEFDVLQLHLDMRYLDERLFSIATRIKENGNRFFHQQPEGR